MSVDTRLLATNYAAAPADESLRSLLGGLIQADWRQALIARGFGYHVDVGSFSTPITGGGDGTVIDLDQPEYGISVAAGYTIIPVRFKHTVLPGLQTTDSHETETLIAVDRASAWAGDGTVTTETAVNMRTSATGNPTGVSIFSAATADITDPVLGMELDRAAKFTDVQGSATTVNLMELPLLYEPNNPPFLVGPCAVYGYWGGSIAATGFAQLEFIAIPTTLISGLV